MGSPFRSALAKLDDSLQAIQFQIESLGGGLDVNEEELTQSVEDVNQSASHLRELIHAQRPGATWTSRKDLELLIQDLENEAEARIVEGRRARLLNLSRELEAGSIKHRFEGRVSALNQLRVTALNELKEMAARPEQEEELPGPYAPEWISWVCNLQEADDADAIQQLRGNFPALEQFTSEMEERYWVPGQPEYLDVPQPFWKAEDLDDASVEPRQAKRLPTPVIAAGTTRDRYRPVDASRNSGSVATEAPVSSTVKMWTVPTRPSSASVTKAQAVVDPAETPAALQDEEEGPALGVVGKAEPISEEATDERASESESVEHTPFSFDVLGSNKRPKTAMIAAGIVVGVGLLAGGIYYFSSQSGSKSGSIASAAERPGGVAGTTPVHDPAHANAAGRQPVEGAQRELLLSVEQCERVNSGGVECRGYASNLGSQSSRVTLDSVDVVDGKGNSFNLNSSGQINFSAGRSQSIAAGSRAPYTVKVPDKDPDARTLTLYVDVNNPHGMEYTFRDVPISVEQSRNGG